MTINGINTIFPTSSYYDTVLNTQLQRISISSISKETDGQQHPINRPTQIGYQKSEGGEVGFLLDLYG